MAGRQRSPIFRRTSARRLMSGLRALPAGLNRSGTGLFVSGRNLSDSLMMAVTRRLGPEHGIVAGQTYTVNF